MATSVVDLVIVKVLVFFVTYYSVWMKVYCTHSFISFMDEAYELNWGFTPKVGGDFVDVFFDNHIPGSWRGGTFAHYMEERDHISSIGRGWEDLVDMFRSI